MRNRPQRSSSAVSRLRLAIDCLPVATREAMLTGVRSSERIIAGAYVDADGGVCPMLAAHRQGSRTDFLSFAKSWDRFTQAARGPRTATRRQVTILVDLLEESLASSSELELHRAIAEHRALHAARVRRAPRPAHALRLVDATGPIVARRLRWRRRARAADRVAAAGADVGEGRRARDARELVPTVAGR
jgi:hypothetical protein